MPRLTDLTINNIPQDLIPKGYSDAYVTRQKRLYIRENKKFVGYGFVVKLYSFNQREDFEIILTDDQLIGYF